MKRFAFLQPPRRRWLPMLVAGMSLGQAEPSTSGPPSLAEACPVEQLAQILVPRDAWHPFPAFADREWWSSLPEAARVELVRRGEQAAAEPWPLLPASLYLDFARAGNRSRFEAVYFERRRRLHSLVLAECVEARGRFSDPIANAVWSLCEETSWCIPAHIGVQQAGVGLPDVNEPIVDLFAAQSGVSLAWTLYLVGPQLDEAAPGVRARAELEIDRRILTPYLERDFGWMGFGAADRAGRPNNWNPWINASVLTAALVAEPDAARRVRLIHRVLRSLDRFIQPYPEDGGCDEGPGYWSRAGGSVMDNLDLLFSATAGRLDVFGHPLIREMGRFIHRVHIADDWYVNIGDCPARTGIDRDLVFRYARAIDDAQLRALATSGATVASLVRSTDSIDFGRALHTLKNLDLIVAHPAVKPPLIGGAWLGSEEMQMMVARDQAGSTDGLFVAAWGGHNAQSHNHNDVGNFIVFADGHPVLVDLGAPTYTAKTFGARRYEIPAMQSAYHNLPTINGQLQAAGRTYAARNVHCQVSETTAELTMDIAAAWPAEAAVQSWQRTVRLERGRKLRILEAFELTANRGETVLNLMTPRTSRSVQPGEIDLDLPQRPPGNPRAVRLRYPADQLVPVFESVPLEDDRLEGIWGPVLTRIQLRPTAPSTSGRWELRLTLVR